MAKWLNAALDEGRKAAAALDKPRTLQRLHMAILLIHGAIVVAHGAAMLAAL